MIKVIPISTVRPGYHDLCRPEILDLVPKGAKRILDLGCGTGELGKAIKKRRECYVAGVELNSAAAAVAAKNLDHIKATDVEKWKPPKELIPYDCIVFADILEHLLDPWAALDKYQDLLAPNGVVVASIPNVAHPAVINQLQKGLFLYQPAGILDSSHYRFFTRTTIFQLFAKADLKIKKISPYPSATNPIQYLITAKKIKLGSYPPLTTIVVLAHNGLKYTQQCIESIRKYTRAPHRIVVVDNGSTDGTAEWIRENDDLLSVEAKQNLGFAAGNNLGIECVNTALFVILNNDTIVSDRWLAQLADTLLSDPKIGIVGPISNYVSGPQVDRNAKYSSLDEMQKYAQNVRSENQGPPQNFHRIVFFCTLIKSELIKKVGLLDPRFGLGNFEDDDYCLRSVKAGYRNVIDRSVFIHHYGETTYKTLGINFQELMQRNQKIFKQKWGIP